MGLSIKAARIISLDSNIFIAAYDSQNEDYPKAIALLKEINKHAPQVFISVMVFEEFLVQIYKAKLEKGLAHYENFLTSGGTFSVTNFTRQTARLAAQIRAEFPSIKTPDAIHLASALEAGADVFVTTGKRLPKKIKTLKVKLL